jgi:C-terminal processing protease CtpA/Prc
MLGAIEGLITSLDDPHTRYFDFEEAQEYDSNFAESYVGIGVSVRSDGSTCVAVGLFTGISIPVSYSLGDISE